MRLFFPVLLLPVLIPAASVAQTPAPAVHAPQNIPTARTATNCPQTTSLYAWDRGKEVKPQKLGELPDANAYAAVYRRVDGCEVPVVVSFGIGGRR